MLKKNHVFEKIVAIAPKYGVSPEAVAGCIIGEHVFNVSLVDNFQNYFVNVYSKWIDKHDAVHDVYLALLEEPDIKAILDTPNLSDYEKFDTIFKLYNKKYRGHGDYPNKGFMLSFFDPFGAGMTFGLGQLSPTRVLLTNDIAVRLGGLPKIDPTDSASLYNATLDVDTNINYVAASVVTEIEIYKQYANFDISKNVGVIATLFNLGNEKSRAVLLATTNETLKKNGKEIKYPVENFYGWFINRKEADIKALLKNPST